MCLFGTGCTKQVTGTVVVEGGALSSAEVTVDVVSITTDSSRRDSYFRDTVMDVGTHQTATFVVSEPVGLPELTGTPVTLPVTGGLTVAGAPREAQADLTVVWTPTSTSPAQSG